MGGARKELASYRETEEHLPREKKEVSVAREGKRERQRGGDNMEEEATGRGIEGGRGERRWRKKQEEEG